MANRYWVGGDGNWSSTTKWSTTSGGASGASVPGTADVAIFDANSNTGTTAWTATVDTAFTITTLTVTGIDAQLTLASNGNLTCSTSTSITAGTQTVLLNGNASLGAFTLVTGIFNINGNTVTASTFTSDNNSGSRTVNFGTNGTVNVTGNAATVWSVTASGTSTVSGTGTVNLTYSGATGTRTISNLPDTSSNIDFNVTAGTDTVSFSTSLGVKSLSFSGFSGTWTNTALSIAGSLTVSSGMTVGTGANAVTFTATSGTNTITTSGKTLDFPVTFNGAGGTFQLQDNCTIGATRTTTLTAGTIDLTGNSGNWNFSTGLFSSSGSGVRSIIFGTGKIQLSATTSSTVWSGATLTNFSYTGTPSVELTGAAGAGVTRTIDNGSSAGGTESNVVSFAVTAGAGTITFISLSDTKNLDFTGFTGTWNNVDITIYGNLTVSTGMTVGTGTLLVTFGATSGTQTINSAGKTFDFPVTFQGAGTRQLVTNNLTVGSTRTTTLTAGTLDLNSLTLSTGLFVSSNSNTRAIAFGTGQVTLTSTGTIWDMATATGFTLTGTPSVVATTNTATARTMNHGTTAGGTESNAVSMAVSAGTGTVTIAGSIKNLDFTGFGAGSLANSTRTVYGNTIISASMTLTAGTLGTTFGATSGTQTIDSAGKTFDFPVTFSGAGTRQLVTNNLTVGSTRTTTLTAGTLDLNNLTLSTGLFSSSNSNTRTLAFGTGQITLTSNGATIWDMATATGLTVTGTPLVVANTGGTATTRTFSHGSTAGGSESNSVGFSITAGTDTVTFTATSYIRNLTFTGFAGTWTNTAANIYGSLTVSTGMTVGTGTGLVTFAATSGTKTITSNAKTLDFPVTFGGAGGTFQLADNLTVGTTRTTTLTGGTLALVSFTLSTGLFSSTGTTTRAITRTTGNITVTSNAATVAALTGSNATYDSGTTITSNYSGATGTRTFNITESGVGVSISAGTDIVTFTAGNSVSALSFTGFSGSWTNVAMSLYGSLTVSTGMTVGSGSNTVTFAGTSGTQSITSNGKTLDFPVTFDGVDGTFQLADAMIVGSTRTVTLTNGTFNANGFNVTAGLFASSNANTRTITMGAGTWTLSGTGSVWDLATATNLTLNKNTANIILSNTSTSARTFAGGGQTYNNLTIGGATGISTLTISGSNTFATLASTKTVAHTITFTAGSTTTVSFWSITGSSGNTVTLSSSAASAYTLVKSNGGKVLMSYANISYATASPANTWYAPASTDSGNNTDVTFAGFPFYWIGGSGTWNNTNTANWSDSSGGTSIGYYPVTGCDVNFDANSDAGTGFTVTFGAGVSPTCKNMTISGLDQTMTLAGTGTPTFEGNVSLPASNLSVTATGAWTFGATAGTQTINTNGNTLTMDLTKSGAGTLQLLGDLTTSSIKTFTLTAGTLDLNNFTLSTGLFSSSNSNTRSIGFGTTGKISLTADTAVTVWTGTTLTNFSYTGTSNVETTGGGANTKIIDAGAGTSTQALNWTIKNSAGTVAFTANNTVKDLTLNGTFTLSNIAITIYGNYLIPTAIVTLTAGTNAWTFAATTGTQTLNSGFLTHDFPMIQNGAGGTVQLITNNLTLGATRTFTLTAGTLDLNNLTLSTGLFSSSNSNTRSIGFGTTGKIALTGTSGTVWTGTTLTNFTYTGTSNVETTGSLTATTITIDTGTATSAQALNWTLKNTGTTPGVTFTASNAVNNLTLNGTFALSNVAMTIYGNYTLTAAGSLTAGANAWTFASTSTQTLNSGGVTHDFPITQNGVGGTLQLAAALTVGSTRTITLTNGTFDANGFNVTTGLFASSNANTRTITMGAGTWTLTGTGSVWDLATATNLTLNKNTANIVLSDTSTSARTFAGGGQTYNNLTIGGATGISTLTVSGSNTFATLASTKTVAHTITFTAGTTTTVADWTIKGTNGNIVTLASSTTSTYSLVKTGGGKILMPYMSISYASASPANTWYAPTSTDGGNNTGITFAGLAYYWIGGTGTWNNTNTANWSDTSGGSATDTYPTAGADVYFDANSDAGTSFTVTLAADVSFSNLVISGLDQSMTLAGTNTLTIDGNVSLPASNLSVTASGTWTFNKATGTQTFTTNGVALDLPITKTGAGTLQLVGNLTTGTARTFTLTQGTLDLNNNTLSTGLFVSSNTNTRSIGFGTGQITLTGNAATIWDMSGTTNFSFTGTSNIVANYSGSTGTRTFAHGFSTGATEAQSVSLAVTAGTDTVSITGSTLSVYSSIRNLNFTGFSGTWSNQFLYLYGNLTVSTGMTVGLGTGTVTFAATTGTQTIDADGKTLDFPVTFSGAATRQLVNNNLTIGATRTTTLTAGTLDLNNLTLSTGLMSITGATARSIGFGTTGKISLTATTASTIWTGTTLTNFSYTGTSNIETTGGGATTKTIDAGAGTSAQALNWNILNTAGTVAFTASNTVNNLTLNGAFTLSNIAITIYGNYTYTTATALTAGTNAWTFAATAGTQTVNGGGVTHDFPMTKNAAGTLQLLTNSLTLGATRTFTLTAGTLDLNNLTLSTGLMSITGATARSIGFGTTGKISLTAATAVTVWTGTTLTNFTYTGTSNIETTGGGATTKTIDAGAGTSAQALNWNILNSAGTVTFTASNTINNLTLNGSFTLSNIAITIYGNYTYTTATALTAGANAWTFAATAGTQTLNSNGVTHDFPMTKNAAGTLQLLTNSLTLGATRTFTSSAGTLDLNDLTLSTGLMSITGATTRSIGFGTTGKIQLTATTASTIWTGTTLTNFSYTGTSNIETTGAGATAKVIDAGAGTSAQALNWSILNSAGSVAFTASNTVNNLTVNNAGVTLTNIAITLYGNITTTAGTLGTGANAVTFAATTGTQTITSAGKTFDFPLTINGVGGTVQLADALTVGSARTVTLTNGTFNAGGFNFTAGLFASNNSNTRTITMGAGTWTLSGVGSVWNLATTTGLTFNKDAANIVLSDVTTTARTFAGGSLTYNDLTIGGTTGTSTLTITGSNTFARFASTKTVAHTLTFTAGTTTTVSTWAVNGSSGNIVTIGSSAASAYTLAKASGKALMSYVSISWATGSTASTWYAPNSTDGGNNTDITFTGFPMYWIGGSGTWDTTNTANWSDSSGGSTVGAFPVLGCDVNFDGNSDAGTGFTVTLSGSVACSALTIGSLDQTMTLAGTGTPTFEGNVSLPASNLTLTATGAWTVNTPTAATYTMTSNGLTLPFRVFKTGAGTLELVDNLTLDTARIFTLTQGTLDLTDLTLSAGIFASSNSNTRSLVFGTTGVIQVSAISGTPWACGTLTGFSYTGTSKVVFTGAATAIRTLSHGNNAGGSESTAINVTVSAGSGSLGYLVTGVSHLLDFIFEDTYTASTNIGGLGSSAVNIYGNLKLSANSAATWEQAQFVNFLKSSGTQTVDFNGISGSTLTSESTFTKTGASTLQLLSTVNVGGAAFTLTQGTLDLNSYVLTAGTFSSSNSNTREITFGTSQITLTGNAATIWNAATATNFTYTGTPLVESNYSGSTGTRTFAHGNTAGGSESNAVSLKISAGSDTVTTTATSSILDFDFTGFAGTLTNTAVNIYGDLTLASGMTPGAGTGLMTFAATSGTQNITSNGRTMDFPVTFSGAATRLLADNMTVGSTRTTTLTDSTLDLANFTLSTGLFVSSNSNVRDIAFGAGQVTLTGVGTIWDMATLSNFTYTGTPTVVANANTASARTLNHGTTAGGSESNAVSLAVSAGTGIVTAAGQIKNLVFTGFGAGSLANSTRTVYGNLTLSSAMTLTAGTLATTFGATSGTQTITSAGRTMDFPVTFDGVGGTFQLADAFAAGSSRTVTLTNGVLNANGFNFTAGQFASNNANTRTITMGTGTWTLAGTGTVWDLATTTNLTFNKNTANITLSDTSTTARTFAGGGLTYNDLTIGGTTGTSTLTVTGSNTFGTIASTKTVAHTITLPAGGTTTVTNWTVKGRYGGLVTLNSSSSGSAATLTKTGGGVVRTDWIRLQDSAATPADTWFAGGDSVDLGGNTGWTYHKPAQMMTFFFT